MANAKIDRLERLAKRIRYLILDATTEAGSGHPTSSLSAVELMTALLFGGVLRYDADRPDHPNNDRLIFSKGHASPLLYALWCVAGKVAEEDLHGDYRKMGSPLEGHPTAAFRYAEAATGSLGQGLSIGFGAALNAKLLDRLPYRTYVLLGDSEMAEGSQWEAIQLAAHYKLDNLIGVLDVNRLGQRGETMYGYDLEAYQRPIQAFGWETILIDGHSLEEVLGAYERAGSAFGRPVMIIARTVKGKGVRQLEGAPGWHGKPLDKDLLAAAIKDLGNVDRKIQGEIAPPEELEPAVPPPAGGAAPMDYKLGDSVATRKAYGSALARIYPRYPRIVSLDGEVSNSTNAERFKEAQPDRFFEMYIAEQNMAGAAVGLARSGKIPFVSTFGAFMTRAFDQIRMSRYSGANIKFVGSHAGVAIGEDGPSQMALEDIAMFRTILDAAVLYPCDAVSTEKLVEQAAACEGIVYIRTTRNSTPVIYRPEEEFPIGGCKVLRRGPRDAFTIVAAGVTVHEALAAHEELKAKDVHTRVIDLYSIKPIDHAALHEAAADTKAIITVEDHYAEGGIGEAVMASLSSFPREVHSLAVRKMPRSATSKELLDYEGISRGAIVRTVMGLL